MARRLHEGERGFCHLDEGTLLGGLRTLCALTSRQTTSTNEQSQRVAHAGRAYSRSIALGFWSSYFLRKGYCSSARSSSYLSSCASTGAATHTAHHSPLSSGADTPHTPLTGRTVADSGTRAAPSAQRRPGAVRRAGERRCGARTHLTSVRAHIYIRIAQPHAPHAPPCHAPCAHEPTCFATHKQPSMGKESPDFRGRPR